MTYEYPLSVQQIDSWQLAHSLDLDDEDGADRHNDIWPATLDASGSGPGELSPVG